MSASWKTKWGARRVRHDPPTLAEALAAAACLTDDREQQVEIAADLMGLPLEAARAEAGKLARDERGTITVAASNRDKTRLRTVVIERRPSRRAASTGPDGTIGDRAAAAGRPVRSATAARGPVSLRPR